MKMLIALVAALCAPALSHAVEMKVNPGEENRGGKLPSSRFEVEDGFNIFLTAEFLWWRAQEDGLYFAQAGAGVLPQFSGRLVKIDPHWDPGVRVGLGGNMPYDEWDVFMRWTFFETRSTKLEGGGHVIPLWAVADPATPNTVERAKGHWNLEMNVLDVELARSFWVGQYLAVRPFFGVRGAWIDQQLKVHYDFTPEHLAKLGAKSDFSAGGLRGGGDLRYNLSKGWSLYGEGALSFLYGRFICNFHEKNSVEFLAKSFDHYHQAILAGEMALGIRWDTYMHHNRYHFALSAAWEQNIWFDINQMNHFLHALNEGSLAKESGNLTTQGGTFGARFDF